MDRRPEEPLPGDPTVRLTPPAADTPTLRAGSGGATPPEVAGAEPGARVGKFVRAGKLGAGGMGEVWKAWDSELGRWVALKFLKGTDADEIARFKREAQLAGGLSHPHIAAIHEVGETQGRHWIAMQFIDGKTLGARRRESSRAMAGLVRDAARAVAYANERGVIHRDLKPDNLMVEDRATGPHVYVMDFGLARPTEGASDFSVSGSIVGTPSYMPPEQAVGRRADARSDVYSLGATLYDVLTGRPPYRGSQPLEILHRVVNEEPPRPRQLDSAVDADLETIALKCLEKEPERRYATAGELADDLERFLNREPIRARPASVWYRTRKFASRHRSLTALAATLALVAVWACLQNLWPGEVEVSSTPPGMSIHLDDRDTGRVTPATVRVWPPGRHAIDLKGEGFEPLTLPVRARPWDRPAVGGTMRPETGTLTADVFGDGARVEIVPLSRAGATPRTIPAPFENLELPTGRYRLVFSARNRFPRTREVDIRKGESARVRETLNSMELWRAAVGGANGAGTALSDFNGDGVPEVVLATLGGGVRALSGRDGGELWRYASASHSSGLPALADLDGDGVLDCVVASGDGAVHAICGADGTRLWVAPLPGAASPGRVLLGDLDGDGTPDVVTTAGQDSVVALSGRGGRRLWEFPTPPYSIALPALSDLDGDALPDVVFSWLLEEAARNRMVALSGRTGSKLWDRETGGRIPGVPVLADWNGDGVPDPAAVDSEGRFLALSGTDGATVRSLTLGPEPSHPALGHFDGDGVPDLVCGTDRSRIAAVSGKTGAALWSRPVAGGTTRYATVADLDADGIPDVVTCTQDRRAIAISGKDGAPLWTFEADGSLECSPSVCDLDGDGAPDVVVVTGDGTIHAIRGRAPPRRWARRCLETYRSIPAPARLDGDDLPDWILVSDGGHVLALSGAEGATLWEADVPGRFWVASPVVADLDGDGVDDAFLGSCDGVAAALSGRDGRALWSRKTDAAFYHTPGLTRADGDGIPDILAVADTGLAMALSGRDGAPLWERALDLPNVETALADLDGDGAADLVAADRDRMVAVSGKDGSELWTAKRDRKGGEAHPILFDFDGDGAPDVGHVSGAGLLQVLSGRDGSAIRTLASVRASAVLLARDVDGDRIADLLVHREGSLAAVSGDSGADLWICRVPAIHRSSACAVASESPGPGDALVSNGRETWRISLRDGAVVARLPIGVYNNSLRTVARPPLLAAVHNFHEIQAHSLPEPSPSAAFAGGFLEVAPPGPPRASAALARELSRFPGGSSLAAACRALLAEERDPGARRLLLFVLAGSEAHSGRPVESLAALDALRSAAGAGPLADALEFAVSERPAALESCLRDSPESALRLLSRPEPLWRNHAAALFESAEAALSGRARAAAALLAGDWDVALDALAGAERAGDDPVLVGQIRARVPVTPGPFLARATETGLAPERAALLWTLARARTPGGSASDAALLAARELRSRDRGAALRLLAAALEREDVSDKPRLARLREEIARGR